MPNPYESPAKPKRRWFQFRLRTILVLIAVLAVPIAWWARNEAIKRERRAVLEWINDYNDRNDHNDRAKQWPNFGGEPVKQWLVGADKKYHTFTDPDSMPLELLYPTTATSPEIERVKAAFPSAKVEPGPQFLWNPLR